MCKKNRRNKNKKSSCGKNFSNFVNKFMRILVWIGIISIASIPLVVSPIIAYNYTKNISDIEENKIGSISLQIGEFYYRTYSMDTDDTAEIYIDKLKKEIFQKNIFLFVIIFPKLFNYY